jgi:hypothetical protein
MYFCRLNSVIFIPFSSRSCRRSTSSAASSAGALTSLSGLLFAIASRMFVFVRRTSASSRSA